MRVTDKTLPFLYKELYNGRTIFVEQYSITQITRLSTYIKLLPKWMIDETYLKLQSILRTELRNKQLSFLVK